MVVSMTLRSWCCWTSRPSHENGHCFFHGGRPSFGDLILNIVTLSSKKTMCVCEKSIKVEMNVK
jgi:hypothetical protein